MSVCQNVNGDRVYLQPLKHKALSIIGLKPRELREACVRSWVLAPAEEGTGPPAIFDSEDLQRVTGSPSATTTALELSRLTSNTFHHRATTAFLLKDVDVVDGYLYAARWKTRVLPVKAPVLAEKPQMRVPQGTIVCTFNGNLYFGHWLTDDLPLHMAGERTGNPFVLERKPFIHEGEYRQLLGIPSHALTRAHFDELTVIEDFSQNTYKQKRYEELRGRVAGQVRDKGARRIFISREAALGDRALANAPELETYLQAQGFLVLRPEELTPMQIAAQTMGAQLVIGVEGSQLMHALLTMATGGVMCCIQPPSRFVNVIRDYTASLGMNYATIVGHAVDGGFSVRMDELKRLLDRIDTVVTYH
jgi:hypothetical protein